MSGIPAIMGLVADLAFALGVRDLKSSHAGRLWTHQIDDRWTVSLNPSGAEVECVVPWGMMFEFNGLPAGMVNAGGGVIAAGAAANEDALIMALERAITKAGGTVSA